MTRLIPAHGTIARRFGCKSRPPCMCQVCIDGARRRKKADDIRRSRGISGMADPKPVAVHVKNLIDSGRSLTGISVEADVNEGTIRRILSGRSPEIWRSTAERLMAVSADPDDHAMVDSTGTVRRLRALVVMGHSQQTLSEEVGCAYTYISMLTHGSKPMVKMALEQAVRRVYAKLSMTPGTSTYGQTRAAKYGWVPPLAWDDETIDDPGARPLMPTETPEIEDEDHVDQVAVMKFVRGFPVDVTDTEFLAAVKECTAIEMSASDIDQLRGWPKKTTENRLNKLKKQYQRSGRDFPNLSRPSVRSFSEEDVIAIREKSAAGATDVEVAMSFGTSRETVRSICRGQRYPQYGGPIRAKQSTKSRMASREYMCGHASNSRAALRKNEMEEVA